MKRLLIFFGMMPFLGVGAAHADITHKLSSSVQLTVNAAATQVERIGSTYSVSGNNVTTQYTPTGGSATSSIGSMTIASGVGSIPTLSATQATAGESWSFTQSFTQGDAIDTTGPDIGDVSAYGDQLSTAAGTAGSLAGTVTSQGALTVTAGGAGTTATGQFVTELSIN